MRGFIAASESYRQQKADLDVQSNGRRAAVLLVAVVLATISLLCTLMMLAPVSPGTYLPSKQLLLRALAPGPTAPLAARSAVDAAENLTSSSRAPDGEDAISGKTFGADATQGKVASPRPAEEAESDRGRYPALSRFVQLIKKPFENPACTQTSESNAWDVNCRWPQGWCGMADGGSGWGVHEYCANIVPSTDCTLISYGVNKDVTFEEDLMKKGCAGLAMDPTVNGHPALAPKRKTSKVSFRKVGAPSRHKPGKGPHWETLSPPAALRELRGSGARLDILKMDCEGCEYAISDNVHEQDPGFFERVGQFIVEVHVGKRFLPSEEHLAALEDLLRLLERAGFRLQHAHFLGCGEDTPGAINKLARKWNTTYKKARADRRGPALLHYECLRQLDDMGYPCELTCQNFLFARPRPEEQR